MQTPSLGIRSHDNNARDRAATNRRGSADRAPSRPVERARPHGRVGDAVDVDLLRRREDLDLDLRGTGPAQRVAQETVRPRDIARLASPTQAARIRTWMSLVAVRTSFSRCVHARCRAGCYGTKVDEQASVWPWRPNPPGLGTETTRCTLHKETNDEEDDDCTGLFHVSACRMRLQSRARTRRCRAARRR